MPQQNIQNLVLTYGRGQRFECEIANDRLVAIQTPPPPVDDLSGTLQETLNQPIDFPPLRKSVFPDDRVILALDRRVPRSAELIAGIWEELQAAGIRPGDVTLLQPAKADGEAAGDPRARLSEDVRESIEWVEHEYFGTEECGYLASSATGERVYLSRRILDADVVITIGQIAYDPVIGYRGTNSVLYPGLSDQDAAQRMRGLGHSELGPDDDRPLRTLIDEIGWLLGTQFTVQVLPAAGGETSHVLAGINESVLRRGKQLLSEEWLLRLGERADLVVAAIDGASSGLQAWREVGAALGVARKAVARDGRILLLTGLDAEPGEGMKCVAECAEPADALKPLQSFAPPDFLPAAQLAGAASWANVSLVSRLNDALVEDLFMTPVNGHAEIRRLLDGDGTCVLIESAQSAGCQLG